MYLNLVEKYEYEYELTYSNLLTSTRIINRSFASVLPEDKEAGGALDCVDGDRVLEERLEVRLPGHEPAQFGRHRVASAPTATISHNFRKHTRCTAQSRCRRRVRHDERDQVERGCVGGAEEHNFEEVSGHCHV